MNCDKIIGVGPKFSLQNQLTYKMTLFVDSVWLIFYSTSKKLKLNLILKLTKIKIKKVEKYSIVREIEKVNPTSFEFDYLFGSIAEIKQNSVRIQLGISYDFNGFKNYYYQNLTFFDSKCRSCSNGQLADELVISLSLVQTKIYLFIEKWYKELKNLRLKIHVSLVSQENVVEEYGFIDFKSCFSFKNLNKIRNYL